MIDTVLGLLAIAGTAITDGALKESGKQAVSRAFDAVTSWLRQRGAKTVDLLPEIDDPTMRPAVEKDFTRLSLDQDEEFKARLNALRDVLAANNVPLPAGAVEIGGRANDTKIRTDVQGSGVSGAGSVRIRGDAERVQISTRVRE